MAIRVATVGATDLRLTADILKVNYAAARTIAGVSGLYGHWRAFFVRLPTGNFANNTPYYMLGRGAGNSPGDSTIRIGGDAAGTGTGRVRPYVNYRHSNVEAYPALFYFTGLPQMSIGTNVWLIIEGMSHVEVSAGVFEWRGWAASCPVGGNPATEVRATAPDATWLSSTTGGLMRQVFMSAGTGSNRSPVGKVIEHVALVDGAFPWDNANFRPHHDAIRALAAGAGASALYDYAALVAAQNAGNLPFANCTPGKADLRYWWTLANVTAAGRANSGTTGAATLELNDWNSLTNGLVDEGSPIAPAHWSAGAPVITAPRVKFFGGRGLRPVVVTGTHSANVRRRWVVEATGTAVPGFDWATLTVTAGAWATNDILPVGGPYRLDVEDAGNPALNANVSDILVGTIMLSHGQSGHQLVYSGGGIIGGNALGLAVSAGAQGLVAVLSNNTGGSVATYAQPFMSERRLIGGAVPDARSGSVAMLNEWNAHNPGHPLMIANMAISGTIQTDWVNNTTVEGGNAGWTFLGSVSPPGANSGNGSGVMGFWAWFLNQYVDCHAIMWTPNLSALAATRAAYVAAVDARFAGNTAAPWIVFPPWRMHSPLDTAPTGGGGGSIQLREQHVLFAGELGSRGFLGPYWADTVADKSDSLHPAVVTPAGLPGDPQPVPDTNHVGVARLGRGIGRVLARVFNLEVKARTQVLGAWFTDAGRTAIAVEAGRALRTLNGAAVRADMFWVSTDDGATFVNTGFTVALDATATRAVLTSTGAAWPASNVRVDYARNWPNDPAITADEMTTEPLLDGLLYDNEIHRGRINLATPAGNVLQGSVRTGAGVAGVPVTVRGAAKLVANERFSGARNVMVRMMAADGVTMLRERTFAISAS